MQTLTWKSIIDSMEKGNLLISNEDIKHKNIPFLWRTSVINRDESSIFQQSFTPCKKLLIKQNYSAFKKYFKGNKIVISFPNLSGDTTLVVPIPKKNKNFATIKDFVNNASLKQQSDLWKCVSREIRKSLQHTDRVWVSTHGLGVPYLHVRICNKPKYYGNSRFAM